MKKGKIPNVNKCLSGTATAAATVAISCVVAVWWKHVGR